MSDSVGEGSNAGGSGNQELRPSVTARSPAAELARRPAHAHARAYDHALMYAHLRAYVSLAVKASGLLALFVSTVILLGGYVQSLEKRDFFCIMAITVIQAAGIFHQDWKTNLRYILDFVIIFIKAMEILIAHIPALALAVLTFLGLIVCVLLFYMLGPLVSAGISSWRIAKLNHGNTNRDANMVAALNIFYSLVIFQGTMLLVLLFPVSFYYRRAVARRLLALEQLSDHKWGKEAIRKYIYDISKKCRKDPVSIKGRDLIKYAAELLDSESQEDYLYGARLLSAFVNKGQDVSWVLLPSRQRIQTMFDSLMISSSCLDEACLQLKPQSRRGRCYAVIGSNLDDKKEIRELAATIVANVAAHIDDLSKYPGAMRCISSLFQHQEETTQAYRNRNNKQLPYDPPPHQRPIGPLTKQEHHQEKHMQRLIRLDETRHMNLMEDQNRIEKREHRHRNKREGGSTSKELVQQGLTIVERLASNSDDNRRIICDTPGLLPKITAPVYSATLIEDVKTKAWADIVTRCLKVLYQLIQSPAGWASRTLRHEISSDVHALSNLKSILLEVGDDEADHKELQLVAMEMLTELALDLSINLSMEIKEVLVMKQLQLFLANGDGQESATIAGRTMVSMTTNIKSNNSTLVTIIQDDIIGHLNGILDDENITRRTIAAQIMANLCAHSNVDNDMKEILPKVLRKIMSIKTKSQQRRISAGQNNPAALGDEENQGNPVSTKNEERHNISTRGNHTETKETSDQEREEQEAFLSLAQVICDKLNSTDLDGAIQIAVQNENNAGSQEQRREAFVDKLKTIIDGNCHPAADSLRIVKLCSQIAKSVMRCEQYVVIFRNKGFKSSLSEASKTMAELESCMLFVGSDFGLKKTVRPLFSEIEKTWAEV